MKIYFTASYTKKADYKEVYDRIVAYLHQNEHQVYDKVTAEYLPANEEISSHNLKQWYAEWSNYIKQCDIALVEGSYPSTINIGFETGLLLNRGKPVIFLFEEGKDPFFVDKIHSPRIIKSEYTKDNLEEVIQWCIEEVESLSNKRFTFFITPEIDTFLENVSDSRDQSKSEYLRNLIEDQMDDK